MIGEKYEKNVIIDKSIYHINFKGNVGAEINNVHLGIIFKLPGLKDMVFCIPLTSPKEKHFLSEDDFLKRNGRNLKHLSWYYLKQTDSIIKFDQMKTISSLRLISIYKQNNLHQTINDNDYLKIKSKLNKYLTKILK